MSRPPPSATWEALGTSAFYRREELYAMLGSASSLPELSNVHLALSKYGGPIALRPDPSKPVVVSSTSRHTGSPTQRIDVYTSSGWLLHTVALEEDAASSKVVAFGFDIAEHLVVVYQDGFYRVHPLGEESAYTQHALGTEATETGILDAKIHDTGFVFLTGSLAFFEVHWGADLLVPELESGHSSSSSSSSSRSAQVTKLAEPHLQEAPAVWAVVPPEDSLSRQTEVLVPVGQSLVVVDASDTQDEHLSDGPYLFVQPSPNGRFTALVSASKLYVYSSSSSRVLSEYDLSAEGDGHPPTQVAWCGSHTVMLAFAATEHILMVGPHGDVLRYSYPAESPHIVSEIDGARVVTNATCDFIQRVPDATAAIFRPGSASPAAILFEAAEQYERKSPKADEHLRSIRAELASAVDVCVDAAGREWDVYWQKRLLKAASYGKTFLDLYSPVDFVTMTQTLRVLNAVREQQIGMPLTLDQYRKFSPDHLVARLTARSHHLLSLRIASYLHLSQAPMLKHWAASKIRASAPQDEFEVADVVVERLKGQSEVSCADVAQIAWEAGQNGLASRLLQFEIKASKQVPLLLKMKEDAEALDKALASSDPDLVYMVLLHLHKSHGPANFFRFIDNKPEAISLFQLWAKDNAAELLRDFNYQDDRRTDSALLVLAEAYAIKDVQRQMSKLREASKFFSEDPERSFEHKISDEQLKLMQQQQTLEKDGDGQRPFVGLSLNETLRQCIIAGWAKKADKLRSDFKVSDKRYWMIKMKALTELRDWPGLEALAKAKRTSPIGFEPFVQHLVSEGHMRQAAAYVPRCEARNRVEMWVLVGEWIKAGEECKDRGDRNKLLELRERSPNNVIAAQLDQLLDAAQVGF